MSKPVDEAALLEALESALEDTIEVAWDQAVMMETYEPSGAATRKVQEDLGKYLAQLGKLDRLAMQMGDTDIAVHTNVIDKVDHGINPDLFTKEYLEGKAGVRARVQPSAGQDRDAFCRPCRAEGEHGAEEDMNATCISLLFLSPLAKLSNVNISITFT
jgi:hypothetical protein